VPSALQSLIGHVDGLAMWRHVDEEQLWKTMCTAGAPLRRTYYNYIFCQYP